MISTKERLDIKTLTVPDPQVKFGLFDIERDLDVSVRKTMKTMVWQHYRARSWKEYASSAAALTLLHPEDRSDFKIDLNPQKTLLMILTGPNSEATREVHPADIHILYPELSTDLLEGICSFSSESLLEKIREKTDKHSGWYSYFSHDVFKFLVLYPDKKAEIQRLPNIHQFMEADALWANGNNETYVSEAVMLQFLFPQRRHNLDLDGEKMLSFRNKILDK